MDVKEFSESICSFVRYDCRSPFIESKITLICEFKAQLFSCEVEPNDVFFEMYLKHYRH